MSLPIVALKNFVRLYSADLKFDCAVKYQLSWFLNFVQSRKMPHDYDNVTVAVSFVFIAAFTGAKIEYYLRFIIFLLMIFGGALTI